MTSAFHQELLQARKQYSLPLDAKAASEHFALGVMSYLFPHFASMPCADINHLDNERSALENQLTHLLDRFDKRCHQTPASVTASFFQALPTIRERLLADAEAAEQSDPAAESLDEIILAYPGFFAIAIYRIAHVFHGLGVEIFPRLLTEFAHQRTGVDIHPAAEIGDQFFIDHGTGVVIGATTKIGKNVKLYQGVTLGALSVAKHEASKKRHPTLEDDVVIYSNATILGGATIIGAASVVGGNCWITESIPPFSLVTHPKEVRVRSQVAGEEPLNWVI